MSSAAFCLASIWTVAPWYAVVVLRLTKPPAENLTRLLANAKAADLSYSEVGGTKDSSLPVGYRLDHYERRLGSDENVFDEQRKRCVAGGLTRAPASRSSRMTRG